ncbi:ABC transporter permease [Sphingomonas sanguinis]|jgi:putative ABC transport system permease protein|uniref:ABC transporter permease n=1 Tax=Sphingomonas sanguinis TaxID=33051 RepID=A0A7Y7US32_9SPHN|nr:ABC transporter permease [Sphingomonas sanguinis]MBZ6382245.1 ABC transporter permease [Sphingomonas sanguinis]NNG50831.1 FtsX-like permease family protein [Sphingomonas sanguinis]NNG54381.1 FtsX-like permease family protein [Sphingomonas sanguinis]NVP31543.1 ABC transporter permease [Sphingomonas sanguinis]
MNRFALLSLYRSLVRHKLYAALNIGGLAVGIAVFLVLGLYVRFETGYEKWLPDYDKLYLVQEHWDMPGSIADGYSTATLGGLIDQLREDFPAVVGTRFQATYADVVRRGSATSVAFAYVDPNFLDVVRLPMLEGDGRRALGAPGNVLINQTTAKRYYPAGNAIGQMITLTVMGKTANYRIAGIFHDLPPDTEMNYAMLAKMPNPHPDRNWFHWGSERAWTILHFNTPHDAARLQQGMRAFVDRRASKDQGLSAKTLSLVITPLADIHLQTTPARKMTVATLGIVGMLTLIIAIVNYVNLATARAGLRAREVAMRKVLGADRYALIRQFLGEAVLVTVLAALIGLMLAEVGLPLINAAGGLTLAINYAVVVPALILLSLVVGIAAGLYPAVLLSRFPSAAVLASARSPGGGRSGARVRELLVIFQFALAIAFMIGTIILVAQTRHVRETDIGFRRDGLVIVGSTSNDALDETQLTAFLTRAAILPGVRSVTTSDSTPGASSGNSDSYFVPGKPEPGPSLQAIIIGPNFFPTFGIKMIAGRLPDNAHRADDTRYTDQTGSDGRPIQIPNVIINRRGVEDLGFRSPQEAIGKIVGKPNVNARMIVGVVENARFFSPREAVNGTMYYYRSEYSRNPRTTFQIDGDPQAIIATLRSLWAQIAPQVPFEAYTVGQSLEDYYKADDRATRLFGIGAGLAVLIGCVGLWGLASFNTQRRVKEIGIRKTLGASATDIVKLLVGQFLRPVLIANLVAWPLAFIAMRTWLAGFDDRISLSPLYFAAATALALTIAVLTVLGQSLKASRAAPAWALRHD